MSNNNNSTLRWPKVILLGDSLTQFSFSTDGCWGSIIADKLQRKCDVINRGFSGYVTSWCKVIIPRILPKEDARDVVAATIFLGANDSNRKEENARQHVPLDKYKQNLVDMVEELMKIGISRDKIILITSPACDDDTWAIEAKKKGFTSGKFNKVTADYAKACLEAGDELGVEVVDLYTAMMKTANWERLLNDGLHLSQSGSELLASILWPALERRTDSLPMMLPLYDQIDNENPQPGLLQWN